MNNQKSENKKDNFGNIAKKVAGASGAPGTFLTAVAIIIVWAITGPLFHFNDTWQLVINTGTTIITFLMVFLIQNTQNRDAAAVQLKLDEIIVALEGADNSAVELEDKSPEELEEAKTKYSKIAEKATKKLVEHKEQLNECQEKLVKTKQKLDTKRPAINKRKPRRKAS